jgi:hypothetical protein
MEELRTPFSLPKPSNTFHHLTARFTKGFSTNLKKTGKKNPAQE